MTKIYFDEESLARLINTGLSNSLDKIKNAIQIGNSLSIPSDFMYKQSLNSLDENLKLNFNSINSVYNTIKTSIKEFSQINNELNYSISNIENYSVPIRQSAIK